MDIFGIISMDIDLYVALCYARDASGNSVVTGIATFSVSISIAFFSETFTMQAQYTFAGTPSSNAQGQNVRGGQMPMLGGPSDSIAILAELPEQAPTKPPKSYCPGPWKHGQFIDKKVWSEYYNSFAA